MSRSARNPTFLGGLALALLVVIFLSTPLARYSEVYYSSADLTQDFSLTRIDPSHVAGNKLMSDQVTQMQPWLMFNRDELRAGRVPLWNPYNGTGCPHLGNYQSAVFSPFSIPFYVLSFRAALIVSAFLKLWALGFFTFLFLKEIGARQTAALIGATAFMFSGHNVLLLSFPHVGALVALPAGIFFVEKTVRRVEVWRTSGARAAGASRPRVFWPLFGLFASFAVGLLAGNPEPFYFAVLMVAAFATARLASFWWKLGRGRDARREVSHLALGMCAACILSAGATAFQTLPFFEYLRASRVLEQRSNIQTPLFASLWPLSMYPNALGNPSSEYNLSYEIPPPNFELTNTAYVGGLVVLLAALSLLFVRRDRFIAFFAAAAALWAVYAYDLFGASELFQKLPTLDRAPINRSQGIWLFAVSVCAAFFIDRLLKREPARSWVTAAITLAGGIGLLAACMIGANKLIEEYAYVSSPNHDAFLRHVPQHWRSISVEFSIGCCAVALICLSGAAWLRTAASVLVLAVVFAQNGWLFKDYNPVTENGLFFPVTPAVAELQRICGGHRLAILTEDMIPPDCNLPYKLSLITNYDGMWVREYDALYREIFGDAHNWRPVLKGSERGLDLLGVEYVLAKWGWMNFDSGMSTYAIPPNAELTRYEILPDRQVSQIFTANKDRLQAVAVWLGTFPTTAHCTLVFRLGEAQSGKTVYEGTLTSEEAQADIYSSHMIVFPTDLHTYPPGRPFVFRFDPIPDSKDKQYRWTISCADGRSGESVVTWTRRNTDYKQGSSYWAKRPLSEPFLFDTSYSFEDFERLTTIGDYVLYRYKKSPGKFHTVGGAVIATSEQEAMHLPRVHEFDPRRLVVLSPEDPAAFAGAAAMGPNDNSSARVVKTEASDKVYMVSRDGASLVHIEDEQTFLANKFRWDQIEVIPSSEFAKYAIVDDDLPAEKRLGLRIVSSDVPDEKPLEVLADRATYAHLTVERSSPGYLVINDAHYPGWKARVNGKEQPLYRANYAFSAVELGSGPSDVEIYYDPLSLRIGLWLGAASVLLGLVFFRISRRERAGQDELLA
jgi:hypothetical protein